MTIIILLGCTGKSKLEREIAAIPMEVDIIRFDRKFSESDPEDLPVLKKKYPQFFPEQYPDSIWIARMSDTLQLQLNRAVNARFADNSEFEDELIPLFRHMAYYFPEFKPPIVTTIISDVDYKNKVIIADSLMVVSLDTYLGADHELYEGVKRYIAKNLDFSQFGPDVVGTYARQLVSPPRNRDFLSQMVYYGKQLYLRDLMLPEATDAQKIGYTEGEMQWAIENESDIWRYFVENELLYSTDQKLGGRFLNPAPFSKFYLQIDNESPGRIGQYIGWQIVRSYMKQNDISVSRLMIEEAGDIFNNAKYKPLR